MVGGALYWSSSCVQLLYCTERCVSVQGLLRHTLTIALLQCVDQNTAVGEPS